MRNIFINNYRRQVRSATIVDQSEDLYHLNLSQESGLDTPEGSFAAKEISAAINGFAPEYKVPFTMYIAGYKYSEIAEKMDLPLGTVKSRIFFRTQTSADNAQRLPLTEINSYNPKPSGRIQALSDSPVFAENEPHCLVRRFVLHKRKTEQTEEHQ